MSTNTLRNQNIFEDIHEVIAKQWEKYKTNMVRPDGRPVADDDITFSETVSYVMAWAFFRNDRQTFDRVWHWANQNMLRPDKLLAWRYYGNRSSARKKQKLPVGIIRGGLADGYAVAPDADVLVAYLLFRASEKWGKDSERKNYRQTGFKILAALWEHCIIKINNKKRKTKYFLSAQENQNIVVNLSYVISFAFRKFSEVDKRYPWGQVYQTIYSNIQQTFRASYSDAKNPTMVFQNCGLLPDWNRLSQDGELSCALGTWDIFKTSKVHDTHTCGWDALRIYLWGSYDLVLHKNAAAKKILQKAARFFSKELEQYNWIFNAYRVDGHKLEKNRRDNADRGRPFGLAIALAVFSALDDQGNTARVYRLLKRKYKKGSFCTKPNDYYTSAILGWSLNLITLVVN